MCYPIFEDYARKSELKPPQFPVDKYEEKIEPRKVKELEEDQDPKEDPKEDPEKESKGKLSKVDEASNLGPGIFSFLLIWTWYFILECF
ncbi:hypothetical protein J1N35_025421 [Gossypium stocksii]|uniref:Uncharacterized protein n=1 Tax=Gossypium stocksii TaxID=47602 RepID=A0A9D3V8Z3_9ROSI|nr:hypothetical protein J1N35_025421 [Gossypium stocksii]